jgi:putative membrane protein
MSEDRSRQPEETPMDRWHHGMLFHTRERTRLSNERTFLAWVRTSLALITLGFVVQRFDLFLTGAGGGNGDLPPLATWVPVLFFVLGGVIILLGTIEFFRARRTIAHETGGHPAGIRAALIVTTLVFLLLVSVIFVVSRPR